MAVSLDSLTAEALTAFAQEASPSPRERRFWLKPRRGSILLAVKNEEQVHSQDVRRIIRAPAYMQTRTESNVAEQAKYEMRMIRQRLAHGEIENVEFAERELSRLAEMIEQEIGSEDFVYRGRIYGFVLAVGDPPRMMKHGRWITEDAPPMPELEFGDVVELSHYWEGAYWKKPIWSLFGDTGLNAERDFAPEDGGPECYTLTNDHILAMLDPHDIICRWSRRAWTFREEGELPQPRPIADRIMIRNAKPPEKMASGIVLPHWMHYDEPIGEVVAVGPEVRDLTQGDWVLVKMRRGTRIEMGGEKFTILRQSPTQPEHQNVLWRWDSEPSDDEKLKYCAEMQGVIQ